MGLLLMGKRICKRCKYNFAMVGNRYCFDCASKVDNEARK